jgi:hypothetical protein
MGKAKGREPQGLCKWQELCTHDPPTLPIPVPNLGHPLVVTIWLPFPPLGPLAQGPGDLQVGDSDMELSSQGSTTGFAV